MLSECCSVTVHLPGLEPGMTVPKTVVISISPQVRLQFLTIARESENREYSCDVYPMCDVHHSTC